MSTNSYIEHRGRGFWARDAEIAQWLALLVDEPLDDGLRAHLMLQRSKRLSAGYDLGLDRFAIARDERLALIAGVQAALARVPAELRPFGLHLVALLDGAVQSTGADAEAQPAQWRKRYR
jgi:hypothetical protein